MSNEIGRLIGKVTQQLKVTNDTDDEVHLSLTFDFTSATNKNIESWVVSNRTIAWQRPARAMSREELESINNTVIIAADAGKKVKTKAERIKEAQATINALKANFPEEYANMVSEMNENEDNETGVE